MKLLSKARTTLEKNYAAGNLGNGGTTANSISDQLNWDYAFMALSLVYFKPREALEIFEKSFQGQWENGMLPQQHSDTSSGQGEHIRNFITKPPLQGYILWRIYELMEDKIEATAFLKKIYPKVLAFHRYLYTARDPEEEGIVYIRHPWESGMDQAPVWDSLLQSIDTDDLRESQFGQSAGLGPFTVQDPFYNALLVWSNESLIKIGGLLKQDTLEVIQWNELTIYSLNDKLWDEERGIYNAYDLNANTLIPVSSISGLLPMAGEVPTQDQAECILCALESGMFSGKSNDYYLCPTNSLNSPTMAFHTKWRGSVNRISNWMLIQGLLRYDMDEMAKRLKDDMLELFSKYGFFEHYDSRKLGFRAIGYGRKSDPVSAAICIDLLMRELEAVA